MDVQRVMGNVDEILFLEGTLVALLSATAPRPFWVMRLPNGDRARSNDAQPLSSVWVSWAIQ